MNTAFITDVTCVHPLITAGRIAYTVGGLSFGISSLEPGLEVTLDESVVEFQSDAGRRCDVEVEVDWTERLSIPNRKATFESGGLWSAYSQGQGTSFYFQTDYLGREPYKYAWFDSDYSRGKVLLLRRHYAAGRPIYPLEYPLDELLMVHRISRGEGMEVHACGVVTADGTGRLFVGHSGAGKSTSSRLWLKQAGACVLSDDRIIVRVEDGQIRMYGTPWHGDAGLAAQKSAPLHELYFLEHSPANKIVPLSRAQAAAELFTRVFVPHHNEESLRHTLSFVEKVISAVPAARFLFRPDETAIEEILGAS